MLYLALRYYLGFPFTVDRFPDEGQTLVYNDLHPFGSNVRWARVVGGMTMEELVDANLRLA